MFDTDIVYDFVFILAFLDLCSVPALTDYWQPQSILCPQLND